MRVRDLIDRLWGMPLNAEVKVYSYSGEVLLIDTVCNDRTLTGEDTVYLGAKHKEGEKTV